MSKQSLLLTLETVQESLIAFVNSDRFLSNLSVAFGDGFDVAVAQDLAQAWREGDFSVIPEIEVLSASELNDANGAFAVSTNKIYLSETLLGDADALVRVLLEEIGHKLDSVLNVRDSAGDEGAIFAALVLGERLTDAELEQLKVEDDRGFVTVDGQVIAVEQQNFTGTAGNDNITGTANADYIYGLAGNDTLSGLGGNDYIYGEAGNDSLVGGDGNDNLYGGEGNDSLFGGDGDDYIESGTGIDTIIGGAGNDRLNRDLRSETTAINFSYTDPNSGNIQGIERIELYTGSGNDTIVSTAANTNYVSSNGGHDSIITGSGNDNLNGGAGKDTIDGGAGDDSFGDSFYDKEEADSVIIGGAGTDSLYLAGTAANLTVTYTNASTGGTTSAGGSITGIERVYFYGGSGNENINVSAANSALLSGGAGKDTLIGGLGNDQFGRYGNPFIPEEADSVIIGGAGNDTLYLAGTATNLTVTYTDANIGGTTSAGGSITSIESVYFSGGDGNENINVSATNYADLHGGTGNDSLEGGAGSDFILGEVGNDTVSGGAGNDTVSGGAGSDIVSGGAGSDTLYGDTDNDTLNGVNSQATNPGQGEYDYLSGGDGADKFILADIFKQYYDDGDTTSAGTSDQARLVGFNAIQDTIQLRGNTSYRLNVVSNNTELYLDKPGSEPDELIGIIEGVTNLNLTSSAFTYILPNGELQFSATNFSINENGTAINQVVITRSGSSQGAVGVTVNLTNGTATASADYNSTPIVVNFASGETSKTVNIPIVNDTLAEGNESINLTLSNPTGGVSIGSQSTAILTIVDNDVTIPDNAGNSLDTARDISILNGTQTFNDFLDAVDKNDFYRFELLKNSTFNLTLNGLSADANIELLNSAGVVVASSVASGTTAETINQTLNAGVYYLRGYRVSGQTNYNLTVKGTPITTPFQVNSITPNQGSNAGQVTLTIEGNQFTNAAAVTIIAPNNTTRNASNVIWQDDTTLIATFNLAGLSAGAYDVKVTDTTGTTTKNDILTINTAPQGQLETFLSVPGGMRPFWIREATVTYRNTGNTDIPAPLLTLSADNAFFFSDTENDFTQESIQFLGIGKGNAGTLAPGETGTYTIKFKPKSNSVTNINFSLDSIEPGATIDWSTIKDSSRPPEISPEAWNIIFNNFTNAVGNTTDSYQAVLDANATYLSQLGDYTNDVSKLLGFEFQQASNTFPFTTLASAIDAAAPTPGLSLVFGRSYQQSLSGRLEVGAFGRGWTNPWDVIATTDADGNVTIEQSGSFRTFVKQPDGSYRASDGDYGTLKLQVGIYTLTEKGGTKQVFLSNGRLNYLQDTNSNKITLGYTGTQLTTLTHSNGDKFTLTYNSQGRITKLTDQANRITTYTYDSTSQKLLSVTGPDGTTSYTYDNSTTGANAYALKSITFPDSIHSYFSYDSNGRLTQTNLDNGAETVTYTYDSIGGVTVTDGAGKSTKLLLNDLGQTERSQDALGRLTEFDYDEAGNLTKIIAPNNTISAFTYDSRGNLLSTVDSLGQRVDFGYEPKFDNLATVRDQRGNITGYSHNNNGNLSSISYTDGSTETFSYDAKGNLTISVNRRGQDIDYTYDNRGLLLSKTFSNGTQATYTYDTRGNLLSAIDADSSVSYTYDTADRITKVTYNSGRFLEFTYDAGGRRTKMVDQTGATTNYLYDAAGRLSKLTNGSNQDIITYTYDAVGRLIKETNGNGTYTTYTYDAASQLTKIFNYTASNAVNSKYEYTYDNLGRRTSVTTLEGLTTYTYDATGQLKSVTLPNNRKIEYTYDAAGNRISVKDNSVTTAYNTNNLNQYTTVGAATYTYDLDGNLTQKTQGGQTWTYSYDTENRLIGVVSGSDTWSYEYDALGNRVASIKNGQRTEYLLDPTGLGDVVGEYNGTGSLVARYTHGLGLVSRSDSSSNSYYDTDAIGSVVGLSGGTGSYLNQYSYLPFGEDLTKTETVSNPFEYVGQYGVMDEGNGLDFMRARFYTPLEGRFMNPDPIGQNGGINLYGYTQNNPVSAIDPTGELTIVEVGVGIAAISLAVVTINTVRHWDDGKNSQNSQPNSGNTINNYKGGTVVINGDNGGNIINNNGGIIIIKPNNSPNPNLNNPKSSDSNNPDSPSWPYPIPNIPYDPACDPNSPRSPLNPNNPNSPFNPNNPFSPFFPGFQGPTGNVPTNNSFDPNDIIGPAGYGTQGYLTPNQVFPYTVRFENQATATAPAVFVTVTHQLDTDLDLSTFKLGDFGFGSIYIDVPEGLQAYTTRVDLTDTIGYFVDFQASLNTTTRTVTWKLTTIDPITGDLPDDIDAGFLPPNNANHDGEGFVNYSIQPKANLTTGTVIDAKASIVFDINDPINTPIWTNTVDVNDPSSTITALPTNSQPNFTVSWSGTDNGSGIASYDVYVSINGAAFTIWKDDITATSATYNGEVGKTYAFYSVAKDNVNNLQAIPTTAQASTTVIAVNLPTISINDITIIEGNTPTAQFTVTLSAPSSQTITVQYTTSDGTAIAGSDYTTTTNTLTFAPNETSKTIAIPILNDNLNEPNETFTVNLSNPTNATLADAQGIATISDTITSNITTTLAANIENLTLTGTANINGTGNAGNNIITGNTGNNRLDGGAGVDTLIGNTGNDIYVVDTTDLLTESLNSGSDTIESTVTFSLAAIANIENLTLTGTANLNGTGNTLNNLITGNSGNNQLEGGDGNDTLNGGAGIDTLIAGNGGDTYIIDATDTITEVANAGTDTISANFTYNLATIANIENLTLTGTANINGTGTAGNNLITGNSGKNTLTGLDGNDTLIGGAGIDTLVGGNNDDTYGVDNLADVVTEAANSGKDTIQSSITYNLTSVSNIENLTLIGTSNINATGDALNNVITGNNGNNRLDGGAGIDTLIGGTGNDTYVINTTTDTLTEAANAGTDTIETNLTLNLTSYTNIENLTLTGTANLNGTGNTLNNLLTGNSGNNQLEGGNGNDTLIGNAGTDNLIGGAGNDTYTIDNSDSITETATGGTDTVQTDFTYNLTAIANIENLTLIGTANLNGTGNAGNNILTGNSGNNQLDGGDGNDTLNGGTGVDTLVGGSGNDTYIIDSTTDTITETTGSDLIQSTVTFNLTTTPSVENLNLTATGNINGTGNTLDNILIGNTGNNQLSGRDGNDTLNGGAASDTLIGGTGNDLYIFQFGQSSITTSDRINDFAIGLDKIDLLRINGTALAAPNSLTRASDSTSGSLQDLVNQVFTDADGATVEQQALGINSASLVQVASGAIAGTYLMINDSTVGLQSNTDLLINLTGYSGTLPALGNVPVGNFFV